jgi:putative ABC transport system permease protein
LLLPSTTSPESNLHKAMPDWKQELQKRLNALRLSPAREAEIIDELTQHLDDRYQELLAQQVPAAEAESLALAELSEENLLTLRLHAAERELPRVATTKSSLVNDLYRDFKYGFRTLRQQKVFTLVAVLTLALGIGATTAVFSVVNGILLRPLPFAEPDRLVWLWDTQPQLPTAPTSLPDFLDWRDQNRSFEQIAAFQAGSMFIDTGDGARDATVGLVTPELFSILRANPIVGRTFTYEETVPGQFRVAVLSYGLWQKSFGGDRNIAGRTIQLSGATYTILGVMPPNFDFPNRAEAWRPLVIDPKQLNRGPHYLRVIGRLKPGVSLTEAQADLSLIASRLAQEHPDKIAGHGVRLESLRDVVIGDISSALYILLGAVAFVLLIACANVANLLLARVGTRQKEIAVRAALGASRFRIIRQLVTEGLLLAVAGGVLGLAGAYAGVRWLVSLGPETLPRLDEITIDWRMAAFTLLVSLGTGLFFGLAPALQISRPELTDALKDSGRTTGGIQRNRLRKALIVSEVSLSLVLIVGAGLLIRSFAKVNQVQPGFDVSKVLTAGVTLFRNKYPNDEQVAQFQGQLLERAANTAGVVSAAAINGLPLSGDNTSDSFTIEGRPPIRKEDEPSTDYRVITPSYFETMGIPLLAGRDFGPSDHKQSPNVAIVNDHFAQKFFPGQSPLGQRLHLQGQERDPLMIVGVVGNVRHFGLEGSIVPETYVPFLQDPLSTTLSRSMIIVARTKTDPSALAATLRSELTSLDKSLPIYVLKPMSGYLEATMERRRFNLTLLSVFGVVALLLAAVGIYGVISYGVSQRTQEIGIRLALGATAQNVLLLVLRQGLALTVVGIVIGLAFAFALTRLMKTLLFNVSPFDPVTFVTTAALLLLVALFACWIPARRATRVDPLSALRNE